MEVRPEYKATEVGVLPGAWETRPCSDLCERIMVGIVIRPAQYYVNHGVPAFRSANIREDGITDTDLVFISEASNALLSKSQTRVGDVLTVRTGYPGTSAVVRAPHAGCNCIDILITRPTKSLDSEWLAIWINSSFGKEQVLRNQGGLAQKHFNVGDMRNLVVALPPVPEQRAIAAALRDVDALLAGLDRLISKKRDLKQAAMQQLLTGQTRLPGFKGEWETTTLGKVIEQINDGATPSTADPSNFGGSIAWVVIEDIKDEIRVTKTTLSSRGLSACAATLWPSGTLIVSTGATIGEVGVLAVSAATKQGICGVTFDEARAETTFMKFWFARNKALLLAKAQGSTIKEVRPPVLMKLEIALPPLSEQAAIAAILSDMDGELNALEARRDKTRALKQGMMQELLTGRTRLV